MERIYLDNAATTPVTEKVLAAMLPYFTDKFGNADSVHYKGREAATGVDRARTTVAKVLGVSRAEIYFSSGGTESKNWAIRGIAEEICLKSGKNRIITSGIEHASVLSALSRAAELGAKTTILPVSEDGAVRPEDLADAMGDDVALVSVMAVNNETGVRQPVRELSQLARAGGALFHTDAVQADRSDIKGLASLSDMLTLSAHKFGGPKGAGVLLVRKGVPQRALITGGEQERGLRGGTVNVPAAVGFAAALEESEMIRVSEAERISELCELFEKLAGGAGGVHFNGRRDRTGVVSVWAESVEDTSLLDLLDMRGVCCSAGAACSSGSPEPSHVLTAMGLGEGRARGSIRFSFGAATTRGDVTRGAEIFVRAVEDIRKKI